MIKITPKVPKSLKSLRASAHQQAIQRTLDQAAERARTLFEEATATWSNKPNITVAQTPYTRTILVGGQIFTFVDKGTKPHIIRARQKRTARGRFGKRGLLAFRASFRAKSSPGSLRSGAGGSSGPTRFAKVVRHPGTKPRNYTTKIKALVNSELPDFFAKNLAEETQ
jgi:hypothetical protein